MPAPDWGVQVSIPAELHVRWHPSGAEKARDSDFQTDSCVWAHARVGSSRLLACKCLLLAATTTLRRLAPGPPSVFHFFPPKGGGGRDRQTCCSWLTFSCRRCQDGAPRAVAVGGDGLKACNSPSDISSLTGPSRHLISGLKIRPRPYTYGIKHVKIASGEICINQVIEIWISTLSPAVPGCPRLSGQHAGLALLLD
jgi:hypothetical protein